MSNLWNKVILAYVQGNRNFQNWRTSVIDKDVDIDIASLKSYSWIVEMIFQEISRQFITVKIYMYTFPFWDGSKAVPNVQ
jgi:hypothetical protein